MFVPRSGDHFPAFLSLLIVGLGLVPPCIWWIVHAVRGLLKNVKLALQAQFEVEGHVLLRPGRVAVRGHVVLPKDKKFAMRVEIDLEGREWRVKNGYMHEWRESARRVTAHPFQIKLDSGKLVDVIPSDKTQLVDKLDQLTVNSRTSRMKTAELSPGERVYLVGEMRKEADLSGEFVDFREPPAPKWALHAELLSAEPLQDKFRARRGFYARWLIGALAVTALVHGVILAGYYQRMHRGVVVPAVVTGKRSYSTGSGKSRTTHRKVDLRWEGGTGSEEAGIGTFDRLQSADVIPILIVPGHDDLTQLGNRPTVNWGLVMLAGLVLYGSSAIFGDRRTKTRPWYWQKKIEIGGSGQLPAV